MSRTTSLRIAAALLFPFALTAKPAIAEIIYTDFSSINGLARVGNVQQVGSALRLTPSESSQSGAFWYGSEVGVSSGFSTEFSFLLRESPASMPPFVGFTFTVQDGGPNSTQRVGAEMGYGGLDNSVAFAFRPAFYLGNPTASISIFVNGVAATYRGLEFGLPAIDDGRVHTARIVHTLAQLTIFLDDMTTPVTQIRWTLTALMDPRYPSEKQAYVGFTAGDDTDSGSYDILSWRMKSLPEPGTLALLSAFASFAVLRRRRPGR